MLAHLITSIVSFALAALVLRTLTLSQGSKPREQDGLQWLEYGRSFKIFAFLMLLIPFGLCIVLYFVDESGRIPVIFLILLFGGLTVPLFLEMFIVKIAFDGETVHCVSPWRATRHIPFAELGEPTFSDILQWWVVPTQRHGHIRLHVYLSGLDVFIESVRQIQNPQVE